MNWPIETRVVHFNSLRFKLYVAGPEDGKPLFFLHGFPEYGGAWRHQMEHFAALGYRAIAPDQRGYGDSDKPPNVAAYRLDRLAGDIVALADVLGYRRIDLVGHDWGGVVAWQLLQQHADRLRCAVIMGAPQLGVWRHAMTHSLQQFLKGRYALLFQLPCLPEKLISRHGGNALLHASGLSQLLDPGERAGYRKAYAGAFTSMLNWYRAAFRHGAKTWQDASQQIDTPLLLLWGRHDAFVDVQLAEASLALCNNAKLQVLEDAGHWLAHQCPDALNAAIDEFFAKDRAGDEPCA